ncbi:MAG: hypothetical protein ACPGR8_16855, partial [Limisphaerales bacterium]
MAAATANSNRRTDAESRAYHEMVAKADKFYLRCEESEELETGIVLNPGHRIFTWVMPRLLWQMGVVSFSQATLSKSASKMVSFMHMMLDAAHRAGARVVIETLVDAELWDATVDIEAESDQRTARHIAVEGYRVFIICSRLQTASLCSALLSHMQRDVAAQTGGGAKRSRKDRDIEDLEPGAFCVDTRRMSDITEVRKAILLINGTVRDNSIDMKDPVTLDFDGSMDASKEHDGVDLVFNAEALAAAEPHIGDAELEDEPSPSAERVEEDMLPTNHLLYPLLIQHSMDTDIAKMRYEQNNFPASQTSKEHYLTKQDDGTVVFQPPILDLARMIIDPIETLRNSALPEFVPTLRQLVRWLELQLAAIGVFAPGLRDMPDKDKMSVLRSRVHNPADCTPIPVDSADYDFGTEDPRMERHYNVLTTGKRKLRTVREMYRRQHRMTTFKDIYLPKMMGLLFGGMVPGIPTYLYKIENELQSLEARIGPTHLSKPSRLAYTELAGYAEKLRRTRGRSFSSFFLRQLIFLLGEMMGQTHTQMLILLLLFPLMSRVGMITFK